jgi:hypothetical protein
VSKGTILLLREVHNDIADDYAALMIDYQPNWNLLQLWDITHALLKKY